MMLNIQRELEICEKAQIGPWKYDRAGMLVFGATADALIAEIRGWGLLERLYGATKAAAQQDSNGEFIAAARTNYPDALRTLARLQEIFADVCYVNRLGNAEFDAKGLVEVRELLQISTQPAKG